MLETSLDALASGSIEDALQKAISISSDNGEEMASPMQLYALNSALLSTWQYKS